ncbi:MAG TPA: enoyl-ACP reductase [Dehalococcoidia bacterium]|jgi:enoyl-[acyl-carrier protein] reductase I|nr:enoyl-ACP reductase [Dehalococcoidia bacterium]
MTETQVMTAKASDLLTGKRALVMGVADKHSLAWGIAQQLHAHGASLAFTFLPEEKGRFERNIRDLASSLGPDEFPMFPCEVTNDASIAAAFDSVRETWGGLDVLAHCIAYADRDDLNKPFSQVSRDGYKMAMEISAYSLSAVSAAAAPLMTGGGSIMTLTYNAVERTVPGYNAMAAAKAALELGVRYLAVELGPQKIRVNAISAGPVRTLSASAVKGIQQLRKFTEEIAPLRENITLEDVGNTAVYLASNLSRMVTGNIIFVDSGTHVLAAQVAAIPPEERP